MTAESARTPAKALLELRPTPGGADALDAWIREVVASAADTGALEGSSVLAVDASRVLVLLRFAGADAHARWAASERVALLLRRGAAFLAARDAAVATGLETWFTLPGAAACAPPPKWKMALVTWCALLPQIVVLSFVVPKTLPFLVNVAVSTAVPVCLLTWVVMPRATRVLDRWLHADCAAR